MRISLGYAPSLQRRNRGEKSSCIKQLDGKHFAFIATTGQFHFAVLFDLL